MALNPDFLYKLDTNSPTWKLIKAWAEEKKKVKTDLLIAADTHDKSNQLRGSLVFINELLSLEAAANNSRYGNT